MRRAAGFTALWGLCAARLASAQEPAACCPVLVGDVTALEQRLAGVPDLARLLGCAPTRAGQTLAALTGVPNVPTEPTVARPEALLAEARGLEAHFDSAGAARTRGLIQATYDAKATPDEALRTAAAHASHDGAAVLLAAGRRAEASSAALEALRRFPDTPLERALHPPPVEALFAQARRALEEAPHGVLKVELSEEAEVFADGRALGVARDTLETSLPVGEYRVWARASTGSSLVHVAHVARQEPTHVRVNLTLERRLTSVGALLGLRCAEDCEQAAVELAGALPNRAVVALRLTGDRASAVERVAVRHDGFGATSVVLPAQLDWSPPARFSPWSLVPAGAGQFAQDRPVAGTAWLVAELGLLGLHLWTVHEHQDATGDPTREPQLRDRRNLSAALLASLAVAGIAEALVVGLVTGE